MPPWLPEAEMTAWFVTTMVPALRLIEPTTRGSVELTGIRSVPALPDALKVGELFVGAELPLPDELTVADGAGFACAVEALDTGATWVGVATVVKSPEIVPPLLVDPD